MSRLYWEDFTPGSVSEYGPRRISREEMVAFAAEFDPQPFHLDEDAARASLLGGLSASGWHSCCLMMRMLTDGFIGNSTFMGAPGIEEVRWLMPLRPGESITIRSTVLETRPSQSRPRMGFVKFLFEMLGTSGEPIMTSDGHADVRPPYDSDVIGAAVMPVMRYFEDIRVGEAFELGRHTFNADEIKSFAARHDPQPFHLDDEAAARSHFGRLCASGWHTASLWMKYMVAHRKRDSEAHFARGEPPVQMGPSPGFRELTWHKPVFVGDTVNYATEVVEARLSDSRPGWGIITVRNTGVNQHGEQVLSFTSVTFVECRPGGGAS